MSPSSKIENIETLADRVPTESVKHALVVKLRHHGDVLLASPVFTALKTSFPQIEVDALVYADTVDMLSLHPAISQVHAIDRKWKQLGITGQIRAETRLLRALHQRHYDLIIHLTEHWRGAWLSRFLKPQWSVGPVVRGRSKYWKRSFSHTYSVPPHALRHTVEANLDALRRIGIQPLEMDRRLTMTPGVPAEQAVSLHLEKMGLLSQQFIHIHPASRWFFKCWPVRKMVDLITRLQSEGHSVVLTAAPDRNELAMIDSIQAALTLPVASLAGKLSLKELAALTSYAKLFIGVDSAPMHIAAAMNTPTIALFGPSGEKQWGPWSDTARVLTSQHTCRPCGLDGCGGGKVSDCLTAITVEAVFDAATELMTR